MTKLSNQLFVLFLFLSLPGFAQRNTFNWNDTVFTKGAMRSMHILFGIDNAGEVREISYDTLKPIVKFLKDNPKIKIEVRNHTDPQGSPMHNFKLSQARAQSITNYLISQGADSAQIVPKGYGLSKPLPGCSAADIAKMKTKEEKYAAYQADRRTEIKIIAPDSGNVFNWGDDRFMKYSRRRLHVQFGLDSANVRKDDVTLSSIDSVVNFLKYHNYLKVAVYVHTDPQGGSSHSHPLSQARAWAVAGALIAKGIDSSRIVAKGWGSTRPLIPAKKIALMKTSLEKAAAYQIDRRVELVILGTVNNYVLKIKN